MNFWRTIVADRYSGGLLGVLLALSIVVQAALAGPAAGAMANSGLGAICTASGASHSPDSPVHRTDLCASACQAAAQLAAAILPGDAHGVPVRYADRLRATREQKRGPADPSVAQHRFATGPPTISTRS